MSTPPIESGGNVKNDELQNGDGVEDALQNNDGKEDELDNVDVKNEELQSDDEIKDELQNDDGKEGELQNDDEAKNEPIDIAVSNKPIAKGSPTIRNSLTSSSITFYVLRYAEPNHGWKIQALFDNNIKFDFESSKALNVQEVS
ncbi:unnamed protein product [Rotaria sp. Silwood2]|nr:unnamed protein product [Rotaria sp. Silwood2]